MTQRASVDGHDRLDWSDRLAELCEQHRVPGAVLGISRHGETATWAYGLADASTGREMTTDTICQVGSVSKLYLAVLAMRLVELGQLQLDTTVAEVLPGVSVSAGGVEREITVEHLLTHTSGIDGDVFTDTGNHDDAVELYVDRLASVPQLFRPGAAYSYCNAGFVVLGRMIEVVTGRPWDQALADLVLAPLGATRSSVLSSQEPIIDAAIGHRRHPDECVPASVWGLARSTGPAGGVLAPVADVLAFARSVLMPAAVGGGVPRVLSVEAYDDLVRPRLEVPHLAPAISALGLAVRHLRWHPPAEGSSDSGLLLGHDGATTGQLTWLRVQPDSGLAVCLLANGLEAQPIASRLLPEIFGAELGLEAPASPQPIAGEPVSERWLGAYANAADRYVVRRSGAGDDNDADAGDVLDNQPLGDAVDELDQRPETGPLRAASEGTEETGDRFVTRVHDGADWRPVSFHDWPGVGECMVSAGRVLPRASDGP